MAGDIKLDFSGLADFSPFEGVGSSALLKQDGLYKTLIQKLVLKTSSSGNPMWMVVGIVQDTDEMGQQLIGNILLGGNDNKGKSMARQFGEFAVSCGYPVDWVRALAKQPGVSAVELANLFVGPGKAIIAHAQAVASMYEGKLSHKIENWATPQSYADAVAANAHRKPIAAQTTFASAPGGAVVGAAPNVGGPLAGLGNLGGIPAGALANGAGKSVTNPLAALAGLNLNLG